MMQPLKNDAGFTLLETLIAVSLFALVGVMGVTLLTSYSASQTQLDQSEKFLSNVQQARALMQADLESAVKRPVRDLFGSNSTAVFQGYPPSRPGVVFAFVRGGHMGAFLSNEQPAIQRIDYVFGDGKLIRKSYRLPDATEETPVSEQILFDDVEAFTARFHAGDRWVEDLGTLAGGAARFPYLVELSIELRGRGTMKNIFSVGGGV